jgi:hypothetical protein
MPYYAETGRSRPLIAWLYKITLISGFDPWRPLFIYTMAITAVMGPLLLQVGK